MAKRQRVLVQSLSTSDWVEDYHAGQSQDVDGRDAFEQDHFDRRDGSHGLHVFRDQGQYGSYPVHDDYGDESSAD